MADVLLHYAVGVFVASRFKYTRRSRYIVGAIALLPDIEVLSGRFLLWRGADWFGWSGAETTSALALFSHGGTLHSLLAVVAVFLLGSLFTFDWRHGAAAGTVWLSHILLDLFTPGSILLWWPFSSVLVSNPLFTAWEPVLVVLSLFFLIGNIMGDLYLGDREKALGDRTRLILRKFGPRLAKGAAQMVGFVIIFLFLSKGLLLISDGLDGEDVLSAGFPSYHIVEPADDGYLVTRWDAFGETASETLVPRLPPDLAVAEQRLAERALCYAEHLTRIVWIPHPVVVAADEQIVVVNADEAANLEGAHRLKALVLQPVENGFGDVWVADPQDIATKERDLPVRVLDAYTC